MSWTKGKSNVNLCHPILVFQIYIPMKPNISIDIGLINFNSMRKRITLSTNLKKKRITVLSISLPLCIQEEGMWAHLLVDVEDAVCHTWKKEELRSIDSIQVCGMCNVRRIFTIRKDTVYKHEGLWLINYGILPKPMSLARNISQTYISVICSEEDASSDATEDVDCLKPCLSEPTITKWNSPYMSRNGSSVQKMGLQQNQKVHF
ncbi:DUF667 domain-containing protein [Caerostris extrusa]|uniref:DUF667 domain-containing protein n=1 Tax=Caerostris extrusa TaxID=172846 RepID=A0AAV4W7A3_CAEEX|nr:DUF667 domain-containing protein [Caerostris extrusa]